MVWRPQVRKHRWGGVCKKIRHRGKNPDDSGLSSTYNAFGSETPRVRLRQRDPRAGYALSAETLPGAAQPGRTQGSLPHERALRPGPSSLQGYKTRATTSVKSSCAGEEPRQASTARVTRSRMAAADCGPLALTAAASRSSPNSSPPGEKASLTPSV